MAGALERVFVGLCRRTEGCCLPAGHRGACDLREVAEVDYEVECIREQKRRRGKLTFVAGPPPPAPAAGRPCHHSTPRVRELLPIGEPGLRQRAARIAGIRSDTYQGADIPRAPPQVPGQVARLAGRGQHVGGGGRARGMSRRPRRLAGEAARRRDGGGGGGRRQRRRQRRRRQRRRRRRRRRRRTRRTRRTRQV